MIPSRRSHKQYDDGKNRIEKTPGASRFYEPPAVSKFKLDQKIEQSRIAHLDRPHAHVDRVRLADVTVAEEDVVFHPPALGVIERHTVRLDRRILAVTITIDAVVPRHAV